MLTLSFRRVRMLVARARSSMVEQRPFKPFVESSSLSALTRNPPFLEDFLLRVPAGG